MIIAVFSSCLTLINAIVTKDNKNIQIGSLEQVEISKDEENSQEPKNIENRKDLENGEDTNSENYELEQEITLDKENKIMEIPVTITKEGIAYETTIYIEKMSTSLKLTELKLEGKEADKYNEITHT